MIFPLTATLVLLLPTLLLTALIALLLHLGKRRVAPFVRAALWVHGVLLPVHLFVTFPAWLGWFGARGLGTRPDEIRYAGPRLSADGRWQVQDSKTLRAETRGGVPVADAVAAAAAARAVMIAGDGVRLRAFRVEPRVEPPRAVVLLVHGLFRSALEVEAPAAMFRRLGCECWLLEQRNHGGSGRAPMTFGVRESKDLIAAVRHVRSQPGRQRTPLLLFGVSLGTATVALALPELPDVAGVVLDAPIDDLLATADRMLQVRRPGDGRSFYALDEPWRSLVLAAVEQWSGVRLGDVVPARALAGLRRDLPMLLIGGGDDDKVPPASVQALFDSLPMAPGVKELWIDTAAGHGNAWAQAPQEYERRLAALLARCTGS